MSDDQGLKDYITHLERELAELRSTLEHIANCANCGIVGNGAARGLPLKPWKRANP